MQRKIIQVHINTIVTVYHFKVFHRPNQQLDGYMHVNVIIINMYEYTCPCIFSLQFSLENNKHWECGVLDTGTPEESPKHIFFNLIYQNIQKFLLQLGLGIAIFPNISVFANYLDSVMFCILNE